MERFLYCVINTDGTYAGIPCLTWEEARELASAAAGRRIYQLVAEDEDISDSYWDEDLDMGYDPYMGCYSDDC